MTVRVNLIQKFLLLNLFWHLAIGIYFGYWFSERLIDSVTRLHTTYLAGEFDNDIRERFHIDFFDDPPKEEARAQERLERVGVAASFLRPQVYPVQILWNPNSAVWSNRSNRIGKKTGDDPLVMEVLAEGGGVAELESSFNEVTWMWNALFDQEALIRDASSYLRVLVPIQFKRETVWSATSELTSFALVKRIRDTPSGQTLTAGVLELKIDPKPIVERTVRSVESVWKRVAFIYMLSNIVLFGLFKSAFNTIQRQGRELAEQERLSNLGKMASYLAHEIRNPLFIIRGSAQTLEETAPEPSPTRKLSRYIIEEVDRLNNMVQDLLGLVKPRLAPSQKPTSLSQAIEDSSDRSLKQAPKMGLVTQLDPDHDLIWFNREQLIQVFTNLFRNARDACRATGTILVESRVTSGGSLQIRITDDGPGIPEDHLDSIFDPFFTGKEDGTGLGLAIVRHLVTGNNASIEAVKPPGTGACFILTVRIAPEGLLENGEPESEPVAAAETDKDQA
jgi:signal transduction histidine kinase